MIWVDLSSSPPLHHPMLILPVNESESLSSYGGHQFLFRSHPSADDSNPLTTSLLYTKLERDEYLTLSHGEDLSLVVTQETYEDFESSYVYPPVPKSRSGLPLHERFLNYVPPLERFFLTVRQSANSPNLSISSDLRSRMKPLSLSISSAQRLLRRLLFSWNHRSLLNQRHSTKLWKDSFISSHRTPKLLPPSPSRKVSLMRLSSSLSLRSLFS